MVCNELWNAHYDNQLSFSPLIERESYLILLLVVKQEGKNELCEALVLQKTYI